MSGRSQPKQEPSRGFFDQFLSSAAATLGSEDDDESSKVSSDFNSQASSIVSWISWFCSLPGHDWFLEVPEEFIEDAFNLTGLQQAIPLYNHALDMILDLESDDDDSDHDNHSVNGDSSLQSRRIDKNDPSQIRLIETSAETLYGLIHARYLISKPGLAAMAEEYKVKRFGRCPRDGCSGAAVVPAGTSDVPGTDTIKLFCPRCLDVYHPKEGKYRRVDGAYFGTTFAHLLFLQYPDLIPALFPDPDAPLSQTHRNEKSFLSRARDRYEDSLDSDDSDESQDDDDIRNGSDDDSANGEGARRDFSPIGAYKIYVPRLFGFRVSERSKVGPKMRWLRWKEGVDA